MRATQERQRTVESLRVEFARREQSLLDENEAYVVNM